MLTNIFKSIYKTSTAYTTTTEVTLNIFAFILVYFNSVD